MITRSLDDIIGTERDVFWGNGQSRRFLIEEDNMGYSVTETIINAGTTSLLQYRNHMEACYCIAGEGEVKTTEDGKVHPIKPGTIYALDKNDEHYLTAYSEMKLVCVFTPALKGSESHSLGEDGSSAY